MDIAILVVDTLILAFLFMIYQELRVRPESAAKEEPIQVPQMTQEQLDAFLKADQEATRDFYASIAALNSFMTGDDYGKEINDVRQQET